MVYERSSMSRSYPTKASGGQEFVRSRQVTPMLSDPIPPSAFAEKESVELSEQLIEKLLRSPHIESKMSLSKDGRFFIHRTVITDIKPMSYVEKVVSHDQKR